ncbi:hypothetical protein GOODEAATRI_034497, partial [Goodea atripinnis]
VILLQNSFRMKAVQIQHFSSLLRKNKILVEEGKPRRVSKSCCFCCLLVYNSNVKV